MSRILALDFEGSNKEPRRGCPIQIGVAVMEAGQVLASDEWLIKPPRHYKTGKPTREVDAYALEISGLTLERIEAEGLTSEEACVRLQRWAIANHAGSLPVVAFSASYDLECYGDLLFSGGHFDRQLYEYVLFEPMLGAKWICASLMSRRLLWSKLLKFSLDDVCGHFGFERSAETHGALEDAILAGRVYYALLAMAEERKAIPA